MNFLIVDDSITMRRAIRMVLQNDYPTASIVEAENGKAAFKALTKDSFDLIITDLGMDDGDGMVFLQRMKSSKILAKKPIIVYTSSPEKVTDSFGGTVHVIDKTNGSIAMSKKVKEIMEKGDDVSTM